LAKRRAAEAKASEKQRKALQDCPAVVFVPSGIDAGTFELAEQGAFVSTYHDGTTPRNKLTVHLCVHVGAPGKAERQPVLVDFRSVEAAAKFVDAIGAAVRRMQALEAAQGGAP
jgi:hypothetical protein